ncbi:MAG: type II secretion system F family protein [Burkholderiaceae bacterium]|nr:type II secretion system F family protein [Sulfuritalea sp.]MCF8176501.1 type II secretion system F family protein [Burkholderiaceae bacterium]MCF8184504.1 type II secretion system F family protein [Polynucleobacter sp.]
MPHYTYRATDADDRIIKGQIEALHETDLVTQLSRLGLTLVRAKAAKERSRSVKNLPQQEVISFMFQLEMLIRAGVPILTALGDMRDASESMEGQLLSAGLYERIERGATLAEAMVHYPGIFSEVVVNLIRTGEVTGQLPEVLKELVRSLKWQDEMASQTKKLMMYPAFVFVVISAVVFFLMIYLVPQLVGFLTNMGQAVPIQTRMLIWVSHVFVTYWWLLLAAPPLFVASIAALSRASPKVRYALHELVLNLPVIGLVLKKMILARLADTFGLMYRTGIPIIEGLTYCQKISGNLVIQQAVGRAIERIANGTSISNSFAAERLFPSLVIRMLQVGESSGALDQSLSNVSYFYTREIEESIDKVQALIEPVMTVVMGLILGWIMMAVLSPIYQTIAKMKT